MSHNQSELLIKKKRYPTKANVYLKVELMYIYRAELAESVELKTFEQ